MAYEDEVLIDQEVKAALDERILAWDGATSGTAFGGVSYLVHGEAFAVLLEGVAAARLPEELQARALTLAGVSPFRPSTEDREIEGWVQFVVLLAEDVGDVVPWLEAAFEHVVSLLEA